MLPTPLIINGPPPAYLKHGRYDKIPVAIQAPVSALTVTTLLLDYPSPAQVMRRQGQIKQLLQMRDALLP